MIEKNNPKILNGWCWYDWANSAYSLVIATAIFPIYFGGMAILKEGGNNIVEFMGVKIINSVLLSYAVSAQFLIVALLSPLLTSIADYGGSKKAFMQFFSTLGALSCGLLYFFNGVEDINLAVIGFVLAGVGYAGSIVFYNSYLPDIATEDRFDGLSAQGFSLGYFGSVLLLIFNLTMLLFPQWYFDVDGKTQEILRQDPTIFPQEAAKKAAASFNGLACRISFLSVGIWWLVFAQYSFYFLPGNIYGKKPAGNYLLNGFLELRKVWNELKHLSQLKTFLVSFFFYNMGVQTVMYLAVLFGDQELHLPSDSLIIVLLILQLLAIVGAIIFSGLSARIGNVKVLMIAVAVWIGICIAAYFVQTGNQFYALAAVVGLVMGGIQALSRATYAKFLPTDTTDTASYFSFYDVTDKVGTMLGTFAFGFINQLSGMRNSTIALMVFFIIGIIMLNSLLRKQKQNLVKA
jgi:UMF1 family MFS transporter